MVIFHSYVSLPEGIYLASAGSSPFFSQLDRLRCADIEETRHCLGVVACPISRAIWHLDHRQSMWRIHEFSMQWPWFPQETTYKPWMVSMLKGKKVTEMSLEVRSWVLGCARYTPRRTLDFWSRLWKETTYPLVIWYIAIENGDF